MVTATVGTSTQTRLVNRGTPQGGVLSPLLWNIAVNKLLRILEGGGGKVVAYADDVAIIFNGKYPQTLCDLTVKKRLLLRLTEGGADLVLIQEPWVIGGKVAGLGTKEYKLMLDPKEGKIRTCILAKRHLSISLLRNYSNGDNTAVSLELQSGS